MKCHHKIPVIICILLCNTLGTLPGWSLEWHPGQMIVQAGVPPSDIYGGKIEDPYHYEMSICLEASSKKHDMEESASLSYYGTEGLKHFHPPVLPHGHLLLVSCLSLIRVFNRLLKQGKAL